MKNKTFDRLPYVFPQVDGAGSVDGGSSSTSITFGFCDEAVDILRPLRELFWDAFLQVSTSGAPHLGDAGPAIGVGPRSGPLPVQTVRNRLVARLRRAYLLE